MSLRPSWTRPKPLPISSFSRNFGVLLLCELRLALKGRSRRWHLVMAILVVASILAPYGTARQYLWPLVWAWPVVVWSGMGSREVYYQTCEFVFTAARPLSRQLSAAWLAGVLITSTVGAGIALRLALAGDVRGMFAWLVATLFIPTLALALGTWSGSRKLFEVTYMLLLYLGPINRVAPFDFMGASGAEEGPYVSLCYLVATLVLGVLAVALRRRQLQMA